MSLKDKGNDWFKKGDFRKAIECYQQYIQMGGDQLKSTYTNIALCYFKLCDYKKVIQACQNALEEDKYFVKAYYRLYLTYMMIPGEDYKVYVNAVMFLKYCTQQNKSNREEAIQITKQYKKRFKDNYPRQNALQNQKIIQILQTISNYQQQQPIPYKAIVQYSPQQLYQYLMNDFLAIEEKLQAIKQVIMKDDYAIGLNMTHFYENLCQKVQNKKKIIEFRKNVKLQFQQFQQKSKLQTREHENNSKKEEIPLELKKDNQEDSQESFIPSSSSQENSQQNLSKQTTQIKTAHQTQKAEPVSIEQSKLIQNDHKVQQSKQLSQNKLQQKSQPQKSAQKVQLLNKIINNSTILQSSPSQTLQQQYNKYLLKISISKDILRQLRQLILSITIFNCLKQEKQVYFEKIIKKFNKEVGFIRFSFENKQKLQIYQKLLLNGLDKYTTVFAPNVKINQK